MAHNINFNSITGQHSFFSVQEQAWHGLGQIVKDYPTSAEAIQFAGLDYSVIKAPNTHALPDGSSIISDNSFFTYRDDNHAILGDKLGKDYAVVQNTEAFAFFDAIVGGQEGMLYETAGALGKGETIFITAKLPGYIKVGNNDLIEKYIFLTTSHDGSGSITAAFTPIRIVCANTLSAAMRNKQNAIRIKHTASAGEKLKEAHKMMGITNRLSDELEQAFNQWSKVRITDKEVHRLIQMVFAPNKETLDIIKDGREQDLSSRFTNMVNNAFQYALYNETQQLDTTKGTVFGAYNAITGYYQNVKDYANAEAKMENLFYGGQAQRKTQVAFDLCEAFAKYGADALTLN
ncbi:DUF932 domain-containing protein [Mucilaginibacter defluvii]|uniref:Phage/plasmid-like protein (TIGR03299 family) n=1 Tax=Mucilaginibacter defluvii TaxID=1196019 RepID=A0ABP9FRY7_9SPHI